MTRQAVTKHLAILEAANLVTTLRHGREKLHYLNPVPIHQIGERWIKKFERAKLVALGELEAKTGAVTMSKAVMNIEKFKPAIVYTIYIASTPEKVWQALTTAEFSRNISSAMRSRSSCASAAPSSCARPTARVHISRRSDRVRSAARLSVTFNVNWPELVEKLGPTLVTYEIEHSGEAVKLTLMQSQDRRSATTSSPAAAAAGRRSSPA